MASTATLLVEEKGEVRNADFAHHYLTQSHLIYEPLKVYEKTRFVFCGCCDRIFVKATAKFLEPIIGEGVDNISKPGGPRGIYRDIMDPNRLKICISELMFCIEHHGATGLILAAHTNCGKYKHKYKNRNLTTQELDQKAKEHLLRVKEELGKKMPEVEVYPFFIEAVVIGGQRLPKYVYLA